MYRAPTQRANWKLRRQAIAVADRLGSRSSQTTNNLAFDAASDCS